MCFSFVSFLRQIFSTILSHSLEEKLWMCFQVSLPFDRFAAEAPECKKQERNRQIREPKLDLDNNKFVWNSWPSLSLSVTWILVWRLRGLPTCSRSKNCWGLIFIWFFLDNQLPEGFFVHQRFKEIGHKKTLSSPGGWRGQGGKVRKKRGKHQNQNIQPAP